MAQTSQSLTVLVHHHIRWGEIAIHTHADPHIALSRFVVLKKFVENILSVFFFRKVSEDENGQKFRQKITAMSKGTILEKIFKTKK